MRQRAEALGGACTAHAMTGWPERLTVRTGAPVPLGAEIVAAPVFP